MRYTIAYSKRMEARFLSHLEVVRVFERAFRRAGFSLTLSQGYNPHPYLSFALPLGVSVASRAEYLEVDLMQTLPVELIAGRLQVEMPAGFRIKGVKASPVGSQSLSSLVEAAVYIVRPYWRPVPEPASVSRAVEALLDQEDIPAGENGKERNIRPGIWQLRPRVRRQGLIDISMLLAAGSRRHVRPEWVLKSLSGCGNWQEERPALFLRVGLFGCNGDQLVRLGLSGKG